MVCIKLSALLLAVKYSHAANWHAHADHHKVFHTVRSNKKAEAQHW